MTRYYRWVLAAIAVLLLVSRNLLADVTLDLLWFRELGQRAVYTKVLTTEALLGATFGIAFFLLVYANLWLARRWAPPIPRIMDDLGFRERAGDLARRTLDAGILGATFVVALLAGMIAATQWQPFLLFSHPTTFGTVDPLFGIDLSFYVFRLPFLVQLYHWLMVTALLAFMGSAGIHYFDRALQIVTGIPRFAPHVKIHLSILVAVILAIRGWGFGLDSYGLLYSTAGHVFGAGYTDVQARLLGFRVLEVLCFVAALVVLGSIWVRSMTVPLAALGGLVGVWVLLGILYPAFVQKFQVDPQEVTVERPFIKNNIEFTRKAYGLDGVEVRNLSGQAGLTAEVVEQNRDVVSNVRLWDYSQLKTLFSQQQELRQFYTFNDVDVDRYPIGGSIRQVMLSAREMESTGTAQNWIARTLQYTHGYGAVMSPVNAKTPEGSPEFILRDIPMVGPASLIPQRPEVYFGETAQGHVIVNTRQQEFDSPSGDREVYGRYAGKAGVAVGGFLRRLLLTLRFADQNFLLSRELNANSRVLFYRQVSERVKHLAPFLSLDVDPYLAIVDGRMVWIQDAYTTSDQYPYSRPFDAVAGTNYIRNAVKAVVDAYDGTVTLYISDPADPIIRSYNRIFPGLFVPISKASASLRSHFRYPEGLFQIQTAMYGVYHMLDPNDFYLKTDAWDVATTRRGGDEPAEMDPYYLSMRLPGERRMEFMLVRPFVVRNKDNMAGWIAAQCDQPSYGRLIVYRFPKSVLTLGPSQIESRFNSDPEISRQVTLWSQQGSSVVRGNLLVIPVGGTLLYVQALYIQGKTATQEVPQLKKVLVAAENPQRVAMGDTLTDALSLLLSSTVELGGPVTAPSAPTGGKPVAGRALPPAVSQWVREANNHFRAAEQAQRAGDWSRYGTELQGLKDALRRLEQGTAP